MLVSNNINIYSGCKVGAGAVVVKDITEPGTYVGVPVRRVNDGERFLILANNDIGLYKFRKELLRKLIKA